MEAASPSSASHAYCKIVTLGIRSGIGAYHVFDLMLLKSKALFKSAATLAFFVSRETRLIAAAADRQI